MRSIRWPAAVLCLSTAFAAYADPALHFAPAPSWVKRVPWPAEKPPTDAPTRSILADEQVDLTAGAVGYFQEQVYAIQTQDGLSSANITVSWDPAFDSVTVHDLKIHRGDKVIDVLGGGQKFTVLRRESNLEDATLDGVLTGSLQIEGAQVGDIVDLALTYVTHDPTLAGHVQNVDAAWNGDPIDRGHFNVRWPNGMAVQVRPHGELPKPSVTESAGFHVLELAADNIEPIDSPKGAPDRFNNRRWIDVSDFSSWAAVSNLMKPLYDKASTYDQHGPLAAEIEGLRASSNDPIRRAELALQLVQSKVRYVALEMGVGGLVPAAADDTWARRYADCKGKTALLLAILRSLGISAEPVVVDSSNGDGLDERLPMTQVFDHVLVRATIGGKNYWLDGTRSGDTSLAALETPDFGWGLPISIKSTALIPIRPAPFTAPEYESLLAIDATKGIYASAPTHAELVFRGDAALELKGNLASVTGSQRDSVLRTAWKKAYDFIEPTKVDARWEAETGVERLIVDGNSKLSWVSDALRVPSSNLAFQADFSRDAGPNSDAPFAISYPYFDRSKVTIKVPAGIGLWQGKVGANIDETLGGTTYHRSAVLRDGTFEMEVTQRAIVPEISLADAKTAEARLRALNNEDVFLELKNYLTTDADITALKSQSLSSAAEYSDRGDMLLEHGRNSDAIDDYTKAIELDAKNEHALANRALALTWTNRLDEAAKDLDRAAAIDATSADLTRVEAMVAMRRSDWPAAVTLLTKLLDQQPGYSFALRQRASVYRTLGKSEEAIADADAILKAQPDDIEALAMRGRLYADQGKTDLAAADAARLVAVADGNANALAGAAGVYAAAGKDQPAMDAANKAIAANPQSDYYLLRAGLRQYKDVDGRRADIELALEADPGNISASAAKGVLDYETGDFAAAIADFDRVLAKEPKDYGVLTYRAMANLKLGKSTDAADDFAAAAKSAQGASDFNSICWDKAIRGVALASALEDCDRALESSPESFSYLDSRGLVELRLDKLDAAMVDYNAALAAHPAMATALYGRAIVRWKSGDKAGAIKDRDAAIRLRPRIVADFASYGVSGFSDN